MSVKTSHHILQNKLSALYENIDPEKSVENSTLNSIDIHARKSFNEIYANNGADEYLYENIDSDEPTYMNINENGGNNPSYSTINSGGRRKELSTSIYDVPKSVQPIYQNPVNRSKQIFLENAYDTPHNNRSVKLSSTISSFDKSSQDKAIEKIFSSCEPKDANILRNFEDNSDHGPETCDDLVTHRDCDDLVTHRDCDESSQEEEEFFDDQGLEVILEETEDDRSSTSENEHLINGRLRNCNEINGHKTVSLLNGLETDCIYMNGSISNDEPIDSSPKNGKVINGILRNGHTFCDISKNGQLKISGSIKSNHQIKENSTDTNTISVVLKNNQLVDKDVNGNLNNKNLKNSNQVNLSTKNVKSNTNHINGILKNSTSYDTTSKNYQSNGVLDNGLFKWKKYGNHETDIEQSINEIEHDVIGFEKYPTYQTTREKMTNQEDVNSDMDKAAPETVNSTEENNGTIQHQQDEKEDKSQLDNCVEIYPETIRQRSKTTLYNNSTLKMDIKQWESNPVNEAKKCLPSVKALRSQFENGQSNAPAISQNRITENSSKSKKETQKSYYSNGFLSNFMNVNNSTTTTFDFTKNGTTNAKKHEDLSPNLSHTSINSTSLLKTSTEKSISSSRKLNSPTNPPDSIKTDYSLKNFSTNDSVIISRKLHSPTNPPDYIKTDYFPKSFSSNNSVKSSPRTSHNLELTISSSCSNKSSVPSNNSAINSFTPDSKTSSNSFKTSLSPMRTSSTQDFQPTDEFLKTTSIRDCHSTDERDGTSTLSPSPVLTFSSCSSSASNLLSSSDDDFVEPIYKQFKSYNDEIHLNMGKTNSRKNWNPEFMLKELYLVRTPTARAKDVDLENIEGYLEKLPSGRKKTTFWNAWKRRYFVAKDGILYYYPTKGADKANMKLPLMGGKIETLFENEDGKSNIMIGIDDGRGHYVVVRCESRAQAEKWSNALRTQTRIEKSCNFVVPKLCMEPSLFKDVLVVDIGACNVRAGILSAHPSLPQIFFPSAVATNKKSKKEIWGADAFDVDTRASSTLNFPIKPTYGITKCSLNVNATISLLEKVFFDLSIQPTDYNLQISVPRVLSHTTQSQLLKSIFEKFSTKSVNLTHQSILALYAYDATSGVVVDIGERIDIVPVTDGYIVDGGVSRIPYGGDRICDHLRQILYQKQLSLINNDVDILILRKIMEDLCYCAKHYNTEKQRCLKNSAMFEKTLDLSKYFSNDSEKLEELTMDMGRFQATEGIFNPDSWGLDHPGIHKLTYKAIQECSMDARKEMSRSIYLAGGVTLLPGLAERLIREMDNLTPPSIKPTVHASPYRYHAAYLGGCVLANSSAFNQSKITKHEWNRDGNSCLKKWSL